MCRNDITTTFLIFWIVQASLCSQPFAQFNPEVDWSHAGLLTGAPSCADTVLQINLMPGSTWDDKIDSALSKAKNRIDLNPNDWVIIYFPPGSYSLSREINLDHNYKNIIFQGAGSDKTNLNFDFGGTNQMCFHIYGSDPQTNKTSLALDLNKGETTIQCSITLSYTTPCWIRLSEEEHPVNDGWADLCVGQITRLDSKVSNTGTLKDQASKQYTVSRSTKIWPITPVMNIGIENLKIYRADEGNAGTYGHNILFSVAVNCWVKGVRFEQTCRTHIWIERSSHIYTSGCYFHDARDFGSSGNGYGVTCSQSTTNCLIENNIFHKLRHAMLVQAGANCNVFAFNYSREQHWTTVLGVPVDGDSQIFGYGPGGDISIHGNYPYSNLFEQNYCERIVADSYHGENWKYNTIIRNRLTNDFDTDRTWIYIRRAPSTTVLGNVRSTSDASEVEYAYCDLYSDVFGFLGSTGYNHMYFVQGWGDESSAILQNGSFFYTSRPPFLSTNYTWPAIGPKTSSGGSATTQTVPAKARYSFNKKTYLTDLVPRALTYSATLPYDQTWSGSHTLTGDITIPSGVTLTIEPGTYVNIPAGKKITVNG
ncbi:hypothetical protein GF406_14015, partial [candidate division KSB1 bacterium]|nr:hypothetical protein [candidate division KSB1 bacterium]